MVTGAKVTLRIDLNMLAGDRIVAPTAFAVGGYVPSLSVDDLVEVMEAEGDRYLARVESLEANGQLVRLVVDLNSWIPKVEDSLPQQCVLPGMIAPRLIGGLVGSAAS